MGEGDGAEEGDQRQADADVDVGVDPADQLEEHEEDDEEPRDEVERDHPVGEGRAGEQPPGGGTSATITQSVATPSAKPKTPLWTVSMIMPGSPA